MPGHCVSRHNLGVASSVMNVVSDFSILLLPLPLIWRLQISWEKKSRVLAVFSVGLFACIASVLRLVYQIELTRILPNNPAHQIELTRVLPNALVYQLDIDRIGLWAYALHYPMAVSSVLTSV